VASPRNIVLVGFMASGKTTVGRALAERTRRTFVDTDDLVADKDSFAELFETEGEAGFRKRERRAVSEAAAMSDAVIATGGGAVLDRDNVDTLKRSGTVVYLRTSAEELVKRIEADPRERPLVRASSNGERRARVEELLTQRTPIYESVADFAVACDGRKPDEIVADIVRRLERPKVQWVKVALDPAYTVAIGRGILGSAPESVKPPKGAERAVIVSHPRIRKLWGSDLEGSLRAAGLDVTWCTFPAGEQHKSYDTSERLLGAMAKAGLHRTDVVYALGGGVVGDVGAFVASTYNRGIAVVQVPTTLLAMVDSAIGGKTGVNLPQGKNLVGTFHQPIGVLADLDTLSTLPKREFRGGMAEVIKYGFIAEPAIHQRLATDALEDIVVRCAKIKAHVVATDEKESGLRAILNYGHTLGHAIESLSVEGRGAKKLHHGEAISIGMVYAARVSELAGVAKVVLVDDHRRELEAAGLPTKVKGLSWKQVRERMTLDKKYAKGLRFVLLTEPGKPVVKPVSDDVLEAAFREVVR
jgi:shikimate kinase/3-dehydroquinate synthase